MTGARSRMLGTLPDGWLRLAAALLLLLLTLPAAAVRAAPADGAPEIVALTRATLQSAAPEREVALPHALARSDFAATGQVVSYRVTLDIDDPQVDRAIFILKMSRSGQVRLNGHDLGSCGPLALERLRCLHQPLLLRASSEHWRQGTNLIEVNVYASARQTNGLSEILVGPPERLFAEVYRPNYLLRVESIDALGWLTLSLGLLALLIYATQRAERLYGWYGITCFFGFLSNLNILVTSPTVSLPVFDWIVFSTRIVFTCLLGITYLAFFERDRPAFVRTLVGYAAVAPIVVWAAGSDPQAVSLLYMPLQAVALALCVASLRWAWVSGRRRDWAMAGSFTIMPVAGFLDLARLLGGGSFTGTYVLVYTSAVTLSLMGIGILGMLVVALRTTRDLSGILQRRVDEREAELRLTYRRIVETEQRRARSEERSRMLQDMHDGFLSTLSVTRVALASAGTTVQQAGAYVSECIDDLRLMLEASSNDGGSLEESLVDFVHRLGGRLANAGIEPSLETRLDGMPALPATTLLQIMRIVQEATSNAIRHSGARTLQVRAGWSRAGGRLEVEVADDGGGIDWDRLRPGRGIANMRNRAQSLGGSLDFETAPRGTRVRLSLDVAAPADD